MRSSTDSTPLLAGVCSRFAGMLNFNVWALRAVFVVLLLAQTFLAAVIYGILALLIHALDGRRERAATGSEPSRDDLSRPSPYGERISDLDRKFRAWEQSLRK